MSKTEYSQASSQCEWVCNKMKRMLRHVKLLVIGSLRSHTKISQILTFRNQDDSITVIFSDLAANSLLCLCGAWHGILCVMWPVLMSLETQSMVSSRIDTLGEYREMRSIIDKSSIHKWLWEVDKKVWSVQECIHSFCKDIKRSILSWTLDLTDVEWAVRLNAVNLCFPINIHHIQCLMHECRLTNSFRNFQKFSITCIHEGIWRCDTAGRLYAALGPGDMDGSCFLSEIWTDVNFVWPRF